VRRAVVVIDDFYADPDEVRRYALAQPTYYPYQARADVEAGTARYSWMTTAFREARECPFKSSPKLRARLEAATGDTIDLEHWNLGFPRLADGRAAPDCRTEERSCLWNCSVHFKPTNDQELGEGVHNHVIDGWNGVGEDGWAGIIYLTPDAPLPGGLKLWRNRDPEHQLDWMTGKEDWELVDDLGTLFNRLILTRGDVPHSGAAGWGRTPSEGRLFQTFFFRTTGSTPDAGVELAL